MEQTVSKGENITSNDMRRGQSRSAKSARLAASVRRGLAFSIVELLVVIGVISLILALGLPAFNEMATQQRMSKARQLMTSTLTRAYITAISEKTYTAVRVMPAHWQMYEDEDQISSLKGRQCLTTYIYRQTAHPDPDLPAMIKFEQRFEELADGAKQILPPNTWAAPIEALNTNLFVPGMGLKTGDLVLNGTIDEFLLDADQNDDKNETFLDADDFLIVFDKNGLVNSLLRQPWLINGYDPRDGFKREWAGPRYTNGPNKGNIIYDEQYKRFNFTGVVLYEREPFVELGANGSTVAQIQARRDILSATGHNYYVDRRGGALAAGGKQDG